MNTRIDHVLDKALALAPDERSALVVALIDSLGAEPEEPVSKAWSEEMRRRKADLQSGVTQTVSWTKARARLIAL